MSYDIEFYRRLGFTVIADPDCPPGNVYFMTTRKRHPDIIVHEGPDAGKVIHGDWAETESEWARRCGAITNIGFAHQK